MRRLWGLVVAVSLGGCAAVEDAFECDRVADRYRQAIQVYESSCRTIATRGGVMSDCSAYPVTRRVETPASRHVMRSCMDQRQRQRRAEALLAAPPTPQPEAAAPSGSEAPPRPAGRR